ncbi:hypothetical protein DERF_005733 [Dermatophagoides farinae]|uniref:Uncharacterized protein n=1 Tax=Dermatophagoides farinae TaxID=6954 RepID=A0A922I6F0_DERFA|nr:hypothetical protein DERF_005733 [Dermatophagoides farinae]
MNENEIVPSENKYIDSEKCLNCENDKSPAAVINEQDEVTKENAVVWDHNITVDSDEQIETTTIIGKVINKASPTNSELVVLGWTCHFLDSELVVLVDLGQNITV